MTASGLGGDLGVLECLRTLPGRALLLEPDGTIHMGRNYAILRSVDHGATWAQVGALPRSPVRRAAEFSRLACRLLRQEVRALVRLEDGTYVASNREGVFHGPEGDTMMRRSFVESGKLPLMPPMRICARADGSVVWGEYGSPRRPRAARLYGSVDGGRHFQAIHTFEAGSIKHVHNVLWDEGEGHYWVLAGDHGEHPGIGRLSSDWKRFEWFVKGEQRFRAVHAFDFGDRLVYATDTEMETNGLISLDKKTGRAERLRDFDGSCIYACRFGGLYALSTSVEPSLVNRGWDASLWLSRDGERWTRAWRARKDRWHADLFQFGSVVLPTGESDREMIWFSGQAIESLDGRTAVARLADGAAL